MSSANLVAVMRPLPSLLLPLLLALATGCPKGEQKGRTSLPPCSKFGDNCEFEPGKLGSCVVKDGCTGTGSECFVCQSQH